MQKRKYRIVAESYLTEYLGITYPAGTWRTNVVLGGVSLPETAAMTAAERRFVSQPLRAVCDAVVLLENEVHLIEAKVREERGKLEQLLVYEFLFPRTPEFRAHRDKRIRKILLTPKDQGTFEEFLKKYGVEIVYWSPPWVEEYLGSLRRFERRGTLSSVRF